MTTMPHRQGLIYYSYLFTKRKSLGYFLFKKLFEENNHLIGGTSPNLVTLSAQQLSIAASVQGCQIFLGPKYQNREKYTKLPQNIPNGHKVFPMAVNETKWS
jgi:hypothetical protein